MSKPTPTERLQAIKAEIEQMAADLDGAKRIPTQCEGEMLDLEHEIELLPLTRRELRERAERLRDVRRERRAAKEATELLMPIVQTLDRLGATKAIEYAITAAEQVERNQDRRQYTPRVRTPPIPSTGRAKEGGSTCPRN